MINDKILAFSSEKQSAILGHMLRDLQFFKQCHSRLPDNIFMESVQNELFQILKKFYIQYGNIPTPMELESVIFSKYLEPKQRQKIKAMFHIAMNNADNFKLEYVRNEMTMWLQSTILCGKLEVASNKFNENKIQECHEILMDGVKQVRDSSFEKAKNLGFRDFKEYLKIEETERKEALTTGLAIMDQVLLDGAVEGGLQKGDTTIFMAPVNRGKTSTLLTIGNANIVRSKDILIMTHEGRPGDIRLKLLSNLTGLKIKEIVKDYEKPEVAAKLIWASELLENHCHYIPYNKAGGLVVEDIVPIIRDAQETWAANHKGKGFDMMICDYPGILTTRQALKGNVQKRTQDQIVYNNYIQLALEYNWHSLLAIQTNREGSRINRGIGNEDRYLEIEDSKETFGPMEEASNVLTINRSPTDEEHERIFFKVGKTRSSKGAQIVCCKSDFAHTKTHGEELGGFVYSGIGDPSENFEELFNNFQNKLVGDRDVDRLRAAGVELSP